MRSMFDACTHHGTEQDAPLAPVEREVNALRGRGRIQVKDGNSGHAAWGGGSAPAAVPRFSPVPPLNIDDGEICRGILVDAQERVVRAAR